MQLVGIAKMAAESELKESKRRVEYRELAPRSYLNRCQSAQVPFNWTLNPYRGCEYGCVYCSARFTHEYMEIHEPEAFERQIFVKQWDRVRFRAELQRLPVAQTIGLGTATDPYQPIERRFLVTRQILEEIARQRGHMLYITTKSDLVRRDVDLLRMIQQHNRVRVNVTVTTLDDKLSGLVEPYAPRPALRLRAVEALANAGIPVGVHATPVLPLISDSTAALVGLARAAAAAGARSFHGGTVFLKACSARVFFPFLERHFPHLIAKYRARFERDAYLRGEYPKMLRQRVVQACAEAGFVHRGEFDEEPLLHPQAGFDFAARV